MYFIEENIKPQVYRTYVNFVVNISWSGNSYNVFLKKKSNLSPCQTLSSIVNYITAQISLYKTLSDTRRKDMR